MKTTLSTHDIAYLLLQDFYANWSSPAAFALAEYFEDMEASTGDEIELDVVAIRCDFSEYQDLAEWADDYFSTLENTLNALGVSASELHEDEGIEAMRYYINDHGTLIDFGCGIIVSTF